MISSFLITAKLYGICILVLPLHCNYIVCLKFFRLWILLLRQALISKSGTGWVHLVERFTVCWVQVHKKFSFKVEKILIVAWIRFYHLHLQWKFKLWVGKFAWGVKAKHCWALSTFVWKQKVWWHHPAMFCLITSSKTFPPIIQTIFLNIFYFKSNS